jgi:hypothetical protein
LSSDSHFSGFAIISIHLIQSLRLHDTLTKPTIPTAERSQSNLFKIDVEIKVKVKVKVI